MTTSKNTATGVVTSYTYAGAAQNEVLSETTPNQHTFNISYGQNDAQGQPEIVGYQVVTTQTASGYVYSDPITGQPLMLTTSSDIACLYVDDGLENPVGLLTDFSTNAFSFSYDPYGTQVLTAGGTGNGAGQNPYAFHGGIQDRASGLVKFGLRWYNPVTGTWTQQDTLDAPLNPANANRYSYAGDDPINSTDPDGSIAVALIKRIISAVAAGESVYEVLTSENLLGYITGTAFEIACDAFFDGITDGIAAIVATGACAVAGNLVSDAVDKAIDG
ncbi:hypothetical protein AX769_22070 (plasmid) [Frondihabitans sp. PAMC 28766]|nr:hypothetical protein AX769_22070 [Frondihabitans sp. PAMC 28766]